MMLSKGDLLKEKNYSKFRDETVEKAVKMIGPQSMKVVTHFKSSIVHKTTM